MREDIAFFRLSNHGYPQASRGWNPCARAVPRAWHQFGSMDASLMTRLRELEEVNRRLKKMYAEERLKAEIIQEAMAKKW